MTLLAYPNCAASGIYSAIDVFSMANEWQRQLCKGFDKNTELFNWDIVSIDGKPVQGDGRVTIVPHRSIQDVDTTDFILIPGFLPLDSTVEKAQCYMGKKFTDAITVEALASNFGISSRHFVRRFKNATGDSPLQYLQRIRIEAAKQKLEKTGQSIYEITQGIGYEDPNSFRKLFKKNTGLSPGEYRNRFSRRSRPLPP